MKPAAIGLLLIIAAAPAFPQEQHCNETMTILDCFNALKPSKTEAAANAVTNTQTLAQKILAEANTGISSMVSPAQSTVKDFLSILSAFVDVPSSNSDTKPLTLDYNFPIRFFGGDEERIKLQGVLAKPDLSSELTKRLSGNDDAVSALKKNLSQIDDATVSATLSPSTLRVGRSITPHRAIYQAMLAPRLQSKAQAQADKAFQEMRRNIMRATGITSEKLSTTAMKDLPPPGVDVSVVEAAARGATLQDAINFAEPFTVLLNNQPQFYGSAIYHSRKDVAGPNERSARLAYEMAFHNLNEFYGRHPECADARTMDGASCSQVLIDYANAVKTDEDPANRLSFGLEYKASEAWNVTIPQYSIDFAGPKTHTFVYSIGYGRNTTIKSGRVDMAINYEDTTVSKVSDNVALSRRASPLETGDAAPTPVHNRFVGSVTYTQKITDTLSIPVSLIYANHESFLGDVNRKLNAHFGISYKLPSGK